jgi:hypothetical protein
MKDIKWDVSKYSANVKVGGVQLSCQQYVSLRTRKIKWYAVAYCPRIRNCEMRFGPYREILDMAQEDAVRLACELLFEYQTCLNAELKNFGVEE